MILMDRRVILQLILLLVHGIVQSAELLIPLRVRRDGPPEVRLDSFYQSSRIVVDHILISKTVIPGRPGPGLIFQPRRLHLPILLVQN